MLNVINCVLHMLSAHVCVWWCGFFCLGDGCVHVSAGALRGHRFWVPQGSVMNCLLWVLETKLGFSLRAVCVSNLGAICHPHLFYWADWKDLE